MEGSDEEGLIVFDLSPIQTHVSHNRRTSRGDYLIALMSRYEFDLVHLPSASNAMGPLTFQEDDMQFVYRYCHMLSQTTEFALSLLQDAIAK